MFSGVATALVSPFQNGVLDVNGLEKLINFQLENGITALCPCGTTGEIATLTNDEYEKIISIVVRLAKGRAFILAGVGGNDTAKVIENCKKVEKLGVDGVLAVAPYYNKPNQAGLYAHFAQIAKSTNLPIMLYNVPSRTVTDISDYTIVKLAIDFKNIIALKDATGNLERTALLRAELIKSGIGLDKFKIYSGDDITTLGFIAMGASGLISVASNIIPKECEEMTQAALAGNFTKARILQDKFAKLFDGMFIDTNPSPVKYCLSRLGILENEIRLPLVSVDSKAETILDLLLQIVK